MHGGFCGRLREVTKLLRRQTMRQIICCLIEAICTLAGQRFVVLCAHGLDVSESCTLERVADHN